MIKNRSFYNERLVCALKLYLEHYSDIRFAQALWNLGFIKRDENGQIVDNFYEESETTFNNTKEIIENLKDE